MQPLSYAVELTQKLIRCPSVTPAEGGALDLLESGQWEFGGIENPVWPDRAIENRFWRGGVRCRQLLAGDINRVFANRQSVLCGTAG